MRAETQATIEAIRKSLKLLAQRMDRETADYRLEEFNAMIEDPNLWNDAERAQKLMRERQLLIDALASHDGIKKDLQDNIELIELGEVEHQLRRLLARLGQLSSGSARGLVVTDLPAVTLSVEMQEGAGGEARGIDERERLALARTRALCSRPRCGEAEIALRLVEAVPAFRHVGHHSRSRRFSTTQFWMR